MNIDYSNILKEIKSAIEDTRAFPSVVIFVIIQKYLFGYPILGRLFPSLVNEEFIFELRHITKYLILFFTVALIVLGFINAISQEIYLENHSIVNNIFTIINYIR